MVFFSFCRTFAAEMKRLIVSIGFACLAIGAAAQEAEQRMTAEQVLAEMDSPTFVPTVKVGKVLPIAKEARMMLIETTEYLETLPNDKAKAEHMKRVEEDIFKTYKPKMKKLTYSQGKLLIKLIDRECHSSSYDMIKAFMGPIRAGFWQVFAWGFGASLKKEYDAAGVDRLTERVVLMVESGQI